MIVLDEQINNVKILAAFEHWYPGTVCYVTDLRPGTHILDEEIGKLLLEMKQPTLVTINHKDFWKKIPAHKGYCILCLKLSIERSPEVPAITRQLLRHPDFAMKKKRMGKVVSWSDGVIDYYEC